MLAVHDAIEVVTLYAVEAAATVDVVPVSVVGVDSGAAGAGVEVGAAALQRVDAGPTAQRVGIVGASKGVIAATPVLGHRHRDPGRQRQHRPATTNNKISFLMLTPFSSFTAGLPPCDNFSGRSTLENR